MVASYSCFEHAVCVCVFVCVYVCVFVCVFVCVCDIRMHTTKYVA